MFLKVSYVMFFEGFFLCLLIKGIIISEQSDI